MDATLRIIDANANRAREGLRTLEDLARFGLDDDDLTARCKSARHTIESAVGLMVPSQGLRLTARDTPRDVGTLITTQSEGERRDLAAVASAGASRAAEAIRVLEECAKLAAHRDAAHSLEQARYGVYELERHVVTRLLAAAPQWRVCVLLTTELCAHMQPEEVCERSVAGGAQCVQIREKEMDSGPLLALARRVVQICRGRAHVIVNDRPDIARLAGADGVHVGQRDLAARDARRIVGDGAIVGVSTASLEQAQRAVADGASYCGVGPMFPSETKPKNTLAGIEYMRAYLNDPAGCTLPHLAISGITPDNAGVLADAGCRGVAVSSAVCGSVDPGGVCAALLAAFDT